MQTDIFNGVESVEFTTITNGVPDDSNWLVMNNIEDNSVSLTSNKDSETSIIPEDKDVAIIVLYTPGDPDKFNFALLEISAINLQTYFNTIYDAATSKIIILAKKKYANLAVRVTSRPQFGYKIRKTYPNTTCIPSYKNNMTKNALLAIAVEASILPYTDPTSGQLAVYFVEKLNADGTTVDSTPPTVNAGVDQTVSASTATLTATATPTSPRTIVSQLWTQVSGATAGITTPSALSTGLTGLATGVYVFKLTATDSMGLESSDNVQVTHS